MRKIKLYIASSLNGYIAHPNGGVEWLDSIPNPEQTDYGYKSFYKRIDTTLMGYKTYQKIMSMGIDFPYSDKENYVITRKTHLAPSDDVEFISQNHLAFIQFLKEQEDKKDIWLIGGGEINSLLLQAKLIDELIIFLMPIVLTQGIKLFADIEKMGVQLSLKDNKQHSSGVMELHYQIH